MGQPVGRSPNVRILIDFSREWSILNQHMLFKEQKQDLIYHIFSCLELDINATLNAVIHGTTNIDDVAGAVDKQTLTVLTVSIYHLMVYHNLFVVDVPDDSNGLTREFPYGAYHVDETTLVLVGDGLAQNSTPALMATPGLYAAMAALQNSQG